MSHFQRIGLLGSLDVPEVKAGLSESSVNCSVMGDMPVAVKTADGQMHYMVIPEVRIADQPDSLLSVQQLWDV